MATSQTSQSYLIVKEQHYNKAVDVFTGSKVKATSEGKLHLGGVIGSEEFKVSNKKSLVDNWITQSKVTVHKSGIRTTISILIFCWCFQRESYLFYAHNTVIGTVAKTIKGCYPLTLFQQ